MWRLEIIFLIENRKFKEVQYFQCEVFSRYIFNPKSFSQIMNKPHKFPTVDFDADQLWKNYPANEYSKSCHWK